MRITSVHIWYFRHEKRHIRPANYQFDKEKFGFEPESIQNRVEKGGVANGYVSHNDRTWVKEVLELRKKAGEYKVNYCDS